jgi:DNA-binding NarL/FixJ family response regulator
MNVKILIVDDHPVLRRGLCQALGQHSNLILVGDAATGQQGLELARDLKPDLAVIDIHLPDMSGLEVTRQMLAALPALKIVIFSSDAGRAMVDEALEAGVCGYLSKSSAVEELIQAIEIVMSGKFYLSPELSASFLQDYRNKLVGIEPSKPVLSDGERHLVRLVAEGHRNKEIAAELAISVKSVETYRSRLMKKLGCSSSAELIRYAVREGIVPP